MQPLLNEREASKALNIAVATLRRWRWSGKGPAFRKLGDAVRYAESDLQEYVDAGMRFQTQNIPRA